MSDTIQKQMSDLEFSLECINEMAGNLPSLVEKLEAMGANSDEMFDDATAGDEDAADDFEMLADAAVDIRKALQKVFTLANDLGIYID
ncbi:MAG: hypothetical protein ACO3O3_13985 [Ilumatobacteraceae bacterium]